MTTSRYSRQELFAGIGRLPHVVTVVSNGQEALDAVKEKRYDVILMDVQMPIMVGAIRFFAVAHG